jgi:hypothetical protein
VAHKFAASFNGTGGRAVVDFEERSEPAEFWAALGGQGEYVSSTPGEDASREPRLFQCSNSTGTFRVEEIEMFEQEDLLDDDVMLLDVYSQLYVWIGSQANAAESAKAIEFANAFIHNATDGRSSDIPIVRITSGNEPAMFTTYFVGWDPELFNKKSFEDPYEKKLREANEKKNAAAGSTSSAAAVAAPVVAAPKAVATASGTFTYEQLKSGVPDGVDPTKKEEYLSNEDFAAKFGVDKATFAAQPKWKRDAKKKELGLF